MIGDKKSDLEAGKKAGLKSILILTGYGKNIEDDVKKEYLIGKDLLDISKIIK
ncbi:MAG: HAD hydrolase-like protein [Cetobacterium sp.]